MYFEKLSAKKLKPKNAIAIFTSKLSKTLFGIETLFECTSFVSTFHSFNIFCDELEIDDFDIDVNQFEVSEQTWVTNLNFLLLIVSDIIKNKPDPAFTTITRHSSDITTTVTAEDAAKAIRQEAESLAHHLGYRLQKHTENEIFTLVPTETKEWMEKLNFNDSMKNLVTDYYSYKGILNRKRDILRELWLSWEPIRKEYEMSFKGTGSDISRIMNKYGIRHADDSGIPSEIKENDYIIELHYDHLFNQLMQALRHMEKLKMNNS